MKEIIDALLSPETLVAIGGLLLAILSRVLWLIQRKTGIEIDTIWRDKLHAALMSHVAAIFEDLRAKNGGVPPTEMEVRAALDTRLFGKLRTSNPDTVNHFKKIASEQFVQLALQYIPRLFR